MFDIFSPFHPTRLFVHVPHAFICTTLRLVVIVVVSIHTHLVSYFGRVSRQIEKEQKKKKYENDGYDYEQTLKGKYANRTISDMKLRKWIE